MGICVSCDSTSVEQANVISQDGSLQQYSYPIQVSYILSKHPSTFICNSDDMDFDDVVSAVRHDTHLQPGHLYFILPLNKLSRPLQPEEMAALAVKANAALLNAADKSRCGKKRRVSFFKTAGKTIKVANNVRINSGVKRNLASKLSAIPE